MIWGHDPPRTHEKIIGLKLTLFVRLFFFRLSARKEEKMSKLNNETTLGQRIRAQRIRMGMTQEELAELLYMKKSTISYYENDKKEMRASGLADLAKALDEGLIAGAGIDVYVEEPLPMSSPLMNLEHPQRLHLTPHIAWYSREARARLAHEMAENIRKGW